MFSRVQIPIYGAEHACDAQHHDVVVYFTINWSCSQAARQSLGTAKLTHIACSYWKERRQEEEDGEQEPHDDSPCISSPAQPLR